MARILLLDHKDLSGEAKAVCKAMKDPIFVFRVEISHFKLEGLMAMGREPPAHSSWEGSAGGQQLGRSCAELADSCLSEICVLATPLPL